MHRRRGTGRRRPLVARASNNNSSSSNPRNHNSNPNNSSKNHNNKPLSRRNNRRLNSNSPNPLRFNKLDLLNNSREEEEEAAARRKEEREVLVEEMREWHKSLPRSNRCLLSPLLLGAGARVSTRSRAVRTRLGALWDRGYRWTPTTLLSRSRIRTWSYSTTMLLLTLTHLYAT
uniref:Uncharacterized protein n=1 Tax=Cacopsylla melanoneura TaxID=428564 RepID=A0A8D8SYQ3_9HEMI